MRLLHVPLAYQPVIGGAETYCQRVSEALARRGHDVLVATPNVTGLDDYDPEKWTALTRPFPSDEVIGHVRVKRIIFGNQTSRWMAKQVQRLPWKKAKNYLWFYLGASAQRQFTKQLLYEISSFKPDVVMTLPHLVTNVHCVLNAYKKKPFPLVMMPLLHEADPAWSSEAMKQALKHACTVISVTDYEKQRLIANYGVEEDRIFMAGAGVDRLAGSSNAKKNPKQILFLGRKALSKGLGGLISAMKNVWSEFPDAELIMAGSRCDETQLVDNLLNSLSARERSKVKSLDNISEADKWDLLRTSTGLVLPSVSESLSIVVLEAWSCGTPAIVYDIPMFRSYIDHGTNGILVTPHDIARLSDAILSLLRNPERAFQMGQDGRRKAEQCYSWEKTALSFEEAYRFALRSWKGV